jgi:hypothetical protein
MAHQPSWVKNLEAFGEVTLYDLYRKTIGNEVTLAEFTGKTFPTLIVYLLG